MKSSDPRDLIVLVADSNMQAAVSGLLSRGQALGIRPVDVEIPKHPQRDSGCCRGGVEFLSPFTNQFRYALVMFDREGCGQDEQAPGDIEGRIEERLSHSGWNDRASAIVLDPELEVWVWSASPHVEQCLGWRDQTVCLKEWLATQGYLSGDRLKPVRPKKAMEATLHYSRTPRSSAIYRHLAETVSLRGCTDRAFLKFTSVMQRWFAL
jgi:hypothetical protein